MILKRTFITGLLFALLMETAPVTFAQNIDTVACSTQTYSAMAHEQRFYRSVLFGQKASADLPIGSVRYDKNGNAWLKKGTNIWNSLIQGNPFSDGEIDSIADVPARRGIFEVKQSLTSDLIPPLTQAFRAFTCRLRAVCDTVTESQRVDANTTKISVQPDGCIKFDDVDVFPACRSGDQTAVSSDSCNQAVNAILDRERALLTLTVAYDSAERTLMQFQGVFEGFLSDFRFPLLNPLWQTVRVIGGFNNISCFLGQCDQ